MDFLDKKITLISTLESKSYDIDSMSDISTCKDCIEYKSFSSENCSFDEMLINLKEILYDTDVSLDYNNMCIYSSYRLEHTIPLGTIASNFESNITIDTKSKQVTDIETETYERIKAKVYDDYFRRVYGASWDDD